MCGPGTHAKWLTLGVAGRASETSTSESAGRSLCWESAGDAAGRDTEAGRKPANNFLFILLLFLQKRELYFQRLHTNFS